MKFGGVLNILILVLRLSPLSLAQPLILLYRAPRSSSAVATCPVGCRKTNVLQLKSILGRSVPPVPGCATHNGGHYQHPATSLGGTRGEFSCCGGSESCSGS